MLSRILLSVAVVIAVMGVHLRADDVFVRGRDKPAKGDVKSESAKELSVGKELPIAGADIIDVHYDGLKPIDLNLSGGSYKVAKDAEKELAKDGGDPVKRKAALYRAIKGYSETLTKMGPHKFAGRHLEYKVAVLTVQQALMDQVSPIRGVEKLQEFKTKFPNSWQINQVMPMIAQLQFDEKNYKGAEQTLQEMSEMEVFSDEVRREAELKIVQIAVKANDLVLAQKRLDALAKKAKGNVLFMSRVNMTKAEVLVSQKKTEEAMALLNQILKDNNDKTVKATAHNTLGECLYKADRYDAALWEFLWVDTVYNQDKAQHAKSLYYLWQTFEKLNNAERAQECRELLLNNTQFTGTEYQRLGQAKVK